MCERAHRLVDRRRGDVHQRGERGDDLVQTGQRRQADDGDTVTEARLRLLGHVHRQRGLAAPARSGDRDQPAAAERVLHRLTLAVPTDDDGQVGPPAPPSLGGCPPVRHHGHRLLPEHQQLRGTKVLAEVDAELTREPFTGAFDEVQRLALPAARREQQRAGRVQLLVQRIQRDQLRDLRQRPQWRPGGEGRVGETECGVDPESLDLHGHRLVVVQRGDHVGQHVTSPERQRLGPQLDLPERVRAGRLRLEPAELQQVQPVLRHLQQVAVRPPGHRDLLVGGLAEPGPQPRHDDVHPRLRVALPAVRAEHRRQPIGRQRPVLRQQQHPEQRPLGRRSGCHHLTVTPDRDRSQHSEPHILHGATPHGARRPGGPACSLIRGTVVLMCCLHRGMFKGRISNPLPASIQQRRYSLNHLPIDRSTSPITAGPGVRTGQRARR